VDWLHGLAMAHECLAGSNTLGKVVPTLLIGIADEVAFVTSAI
jgi:hypothetical protein